ncbi:prolipoprotein diacylglyceryl transferase [Nonomuraea sp. 3-1Str]|uniref:prolipoprotein diacylglyceryl transferase n=1 Tax=Nonomuraea sp. 3-1Str TaxID=2929801 RepID=UPI00285D6D31|nr:prolipoprotein diacylglyceryl transferase [Nonomuraea sp. 3-1Str]MDR8409541.1 prolipoprotein diacylglyceryl transferase [Nonomuraea sp. 3-1Str]
MPLASIPSPAQGVWYLGFIPIRAYALCIVAGVIFAVWLSERRWRARGGQKGTIIDIAVPAVIFGLIGGRLYHVITDWQTYFGERAIKPAYKALFIWEGGLGIWGAIALGGVGVWIACRRRGLSLSAVADTVAPGIAFAQAIGRWGNWFNQELYGSPTTLPWGLEIDQMHGGEPGVLYHPTFLYESLWDLALGFGLLLIGSRLTLRHGRLFALYVAGYTLGRFWIEGLRIDPVGGVDHAVMFLGLRLNQWTALVVFVGALIYFWATRNKDAVEHVVPPQAHSLEGLAGLEGEDAQAADPAHPADQADETEAPAASSPGDGEEAGGETGGSARTGAVEPGERPEGSVDPEGEPEAEGPDRAPGEHARAEEKHAR